MRMVKVMMGVRSDVTIVIVDIVVVVDVDGVMRGENAGAGRRGGSRRCRRRRKRGGHTAAAATAALAEIPFSGGGGGSGGGGCRCGGGLGGSLLHLLLEMDFGVTLLFVGSCELPAADVAGEGLLPRVSANVRGEVIRPGE